eukprot:scaffold35678_cov52-Phaeocystis_antarctica.AAC.1
MPPPASSLPLRRFALVRRAVSARADGVSIATKPPASGKPKTGSTAAETATSKNWRTCASMSRSHTST